MNKKVSIVPIDNLIIVDGEALCFAFAAPANVHAIQWHDGQGHIEWTDDYNHPLHGASAYDAEVAPYVALWEAEKARLAQAAADAEAVRLAQYNSVEARAARVREERDRRIAATDYLMAVDYPLTEDQRQPWAVYRQALRDITVQEGFPWSGGGEDDAACPWPVHPA